ncbi:peptidoglycan O-acetyltransferase [mine drainage metagenome]|uniref:Peptidoglycan O-acetyltransferase n=1 Tax=mine drainage metagenome TaxID=410659 RepID=A0A1J5Q060_9ZZZZ
MLFSSPLFIFLFLPVVLGIYFAVPAKLRNLLLAIVSLLFYAWGEGVYVIVMIVSMSLNYVFGILLHEYRNQAKWILAVAVAINLGMLAYFKYVVFIIHNVGLILESIGVQKISLDSVHLPLGISFFTFHSISYLIDIYRKDAPAQKNPIDLALYISFFPQLIAGPIVRYHDVSDQLRKRIVLAEDVAVGIRRFVIGLGKKVIIANTLAVPADQIFSLSHDLLTFSLAWLGIICYTLQIYFDSSGYSDMAIGLARMFGFRFLENFNYPYVSRSIQEFWHRWHISLSNWFRDYLYIPLGGNRVKPWRVYFNLVLVFFLCGLWHGASWNFVIWGMLHGTFLVLERFGLATFINNKARWLGHAYALLVVIIGWVFFRSEGLHGALAYLKAMAGYSKGTGIEYHVSLYINQEVMLVLMLAIVGATPFMLHLKIPQVMQVRDEGGRCQPAKVISFINVSYISVVFLVSISFLAAGTYNPFIYFRF